MSFSIFHVILIALLVLPAFLPLIIKKPEGPNRFGPQPAPQSFGSAIQVCMTKYVDGQGRATRSEYWWFYLFTVLVGFGIGIIAGITGLEALSYGAYAFTLPSIVAGVRRLHDINRSGWWLLIGFGLGGFVLLYWLTQPSQRDEQQVAQVFE
ncbi:MAG: DUF805 domain-containing protein [Asticcacaulis sp.]